MAETITKGGIATKDLKIDGIENRGIKNLADEETIVKAVQELVNERVKDQENLLEQHFDDLDYYDYMFRCGRNDTQKSAHKPMETPTDSKANVGASMFFRQIMQSAAKTYSLQHGRDRFFGYSPVMTNGVPYSDEDGKLQAEQLNTLAKWNLDQDHFDDRILAPIDMMIPRDGLALLAANWIRKKESRRFTVPGTIDEETGKQSDNTEMEIELLTENRASFSLISPQMTRLDPTIDSIQDQECFSVLNIIGIGDCVNYVQQGYWSEDAFRKLDDDARWDGTSGNARASETDANAGLSNEPSTDTGKFLHWRCWINLPISEEGALDEKTVVPQRYIAEFVGNSIDQAVCVRIERNDDPDDEIPVQVIWDYPDSPGRFFHISKGHILKNNYAVETTTINQMIDNVSLCLDPPTIEQKGAVQNTDRKFGRGKRWVVRGNINEAVKEWNIADRTQTSLGLLQYIKDDSKMAVHTDPSQMGEGLGARASATEASGVMRLSAAPSVMNSKYITNQLFTFVARKLASYWKAYSLPEQVVRITDTSAPIQDIKPSEIYADFDVKVDIVDEIVDDIVEEQKISQDLALITSNEMLAQKVDIDALLEEYFIRRYKKSFIANNADFDSREAARRELQIMLVNQQPVQAQQEQNHRVHLDIKRAERLRYRGVEDQYMPGIQYLDNNIDQHAQMMGGGATGSQQPQQPSPTDGQPLGGAGDMPAQAPGGGQPAGAGTPMQQAAGQ